MTSSIIGIKSCLVSTQNLTCGFKMLKSKWKFKMRLVKQVKKPKRFQNTLCGWCSFLKRTERTKNKWKCAWETCFSVFFFFFFFKLLQNHRLQFFLKFSRVEPNERPHPDFKTMIRQGLKLVNACLTLRFLPKLQLSHIRLYFNPRDGFLSRFWTKCKSSKC